MLDNYSKEYPKEAAELKRRWEGKLPDGWQDALPKYSPKDAAVATRKLSEAVLTKLTEVIPELIGGSADLTGSNNTRWKTAVDFQPVSPMQAIIYDKDPEQLTYYMQPSTKLGDYSGRYIRYGVREHGMHAVMNGIAAYQGLIPFGGTFLNFLTQVFGIVAFHYTQFIYLTMYVTIVMVGVLLVSAHCRSYGSSTS